MGDKIVSSSHFIPEVEMRQVWEEGDALQTTGTVGLDYRIQMLTPAVNEGIPLHKVLQLQSPEYEDGGEEKTEAAEEQ